MEPLSIATLGWTNTDGSDDTGTLWDTSCVQTLLNFHNMERQAIDTLQESVFGSAEMDNLLYSYKDAHTITVSPGVAISNDGITHTLENATDIDLTGIGKNACVCLWIGNHSSDNRLILRATTTPDTAPLNMLHAKRLRWHVETDTNGDLIRFAPPKTHLDRAIPTYYDGLYRPVNCLIRDGRELTRTHTLFAALYAEIGHAHDIGVNLVTLTVTADATANTLNATAHAWIDTQQFRIDSTDTLPSPLVAGKTYHVVTAAANTFKVSLTSGGTAIDLTTAGTGTITCTKIDTFQAFAHPFVNNDTVDLHVIAGVLPSTLSEATTYHIVNATTDTLQLATKSGGAAIATTTNGTIGRWTLAHTGLFRIPDGRGRALIGAGTGSGGLTARALGTTLGEEKHLQTIAEMPAHTHNIPTTGAGQGTYLYYYPSINDGFQRFIPSQSTGNGQPFNVIQPSLVGLPIMAY